MFQGIYKTVAIWFVSLTLIVVACDIPLSWMEKGSPTALRFLFEIVILVFVWALFYLIFLAKIVQEHNIIEINDALAKADELWKSNEHLKAAEIYRKIIEHVYIKPPLITMTIHPDVLQRVVEFHLKIEQKSFILTLGKIGRDTLPFETALEFDTIEQELLEGKICALCKGNIQPPGDFIGIQLGITKRVYSEEDMGGNADSLTSPERLPDSFEIQICSHCKPDQSKNDSHVNNLLLSTLVAQKVIKHIKTLARIQGIREGERMEFTLLRCKGDNWLPMWLYKNTWDGPDIELYKEQERICRKMEDRHGLLNALNKQISILENRDEFEKALELYEEQEQIYRELWDKNGLKESFFQQANLLYTRRKFHKAMERYKHHEMLCIRLGDKNGLQASFHRQGNVLFALNKYHMAMEMYRKAERLCRETGNTNSVQKLLFNQASIFCLYGRFDKAMELYQEQGQICRDTNDEPGLQMSLANQLLLLKLHEFFIVCIIVMFFAMLSIPYYWDSRIALNIYFAIHGVIIGSAVFSSLLLSMNWNPTPNILLTQLSIFLVLFINSILEFFRRCFRHNQYQKSIEERLNKKKAMHHRIIRFLTTIQVMRFLTFLKTTCQPLITFIRWTWQKIIFLIVKWCKSTGITFSEGEPRWSKLIKFFEALYRVIDTLIQWFWPWKRSDDSGFLRLLDNLGKIDILN